MAVTEKAGLDRDGLHRKVGSREQAASSLNVGPADLLCQAPSQRRSTAAFERPPPHGHVRENVAHAERLVGVLADEPPRSGGR
jgi:hypothetical protein